jgi:hypothetical protein
MSNWMLTSDSSSTTRAHVTKLLTHCTASCINRRAMRILIRLALARTHLLSELVASRWCNRTISLAVIIKSPIEKRKEFFPICFYDDAVSEYERERGILMSLDRETARSTPQVILYDRGKTLSVVIWSEADISDHHETLILPYNYGGAACLLHIYDINSLSLSLSHSACTYKTVNA